MFVDLALIHVVVVFVVAVLGVELTDRAFTFTGLCIKNEVAKFVSIPSTTFVWVLNYVLNFSVLNRLFLMLESY